MEGMTYEEKVVPSDNHGKEADLGLSKVGVVFLNEFFRWNKITADLYKQWERA
jgi:hypothetical protein